MKLKFPKILKDGYSKFMTDGVILNWSNVNRCIFVLFLGAADISLWIIWWGVSANIESLRHWINFQHYPVLMTIYSLSVIGYFLLIAIAHLFRKNAFIEKYICYITVFYLGITFIYGGYCVGIISPASVAGYVSLVTVGLVLFKSKEVYWTVLPVSIFMAICSYLSVTNQIAYAPIYSQELQASTLHTNSFWVYSMLYFYIPIFSASLVLFVILLIQWSYREQHINKISQIDPLTLVYNRRKISEILTDQQNQQQNYILVLLDLDHFKSINDNYGHELGDHVLKTVADILSQNVRLEDRVGRFGGEEFILILNNKTLEQAIKIAERCRTHIEQHQITLSDAEKISVTASFGISLPTQQSKNFDKDRLVKQADQALYLAKAKGRNQVCTFLDIA